MARPRKKLDCSDEYADVLRLFKDEQEVWKKERLQVIKLLLETPKSYQEVADIVGRSRRIIIEWVKNFREGGISKLLIRGNGGGRKSVVSDDVKEALVEKLREGEFRTARQFRKWLQEEHGVEIGLKGVYYHLGKLGGRLKVPRPSHTKKDKQQVEQFRATLAERIEGLHLPREKKVRLWIYDEMRYGLHPLVRRVWSLAGQRVVCPLQRRYQWAYLFGALDVSTGQSEFLHTQSINKEFDRAFLKQICQSDPESVHVVIGDGAGFHHRESAEHDEPLPDNLHILTLPPYSPELNPVEKLWDVIKDEICNTCWASLTALEDKIDKVLQHFWKRQGKLRSFVTNSYLRSELNAS